ncbi:MAG: ArnT family glycosyltransferase, partial [Streptosporangiaceae bacterium]
MDFTTSTHPGPRAPAAAPAPALTPAPRAGIALIAVAAVAAVAVEMAVSARYGYVRDELYFLSAGQHLAFGYVDQPPLTPLLARITAALTGGTLAGFRILPALCLAALVVMTAAMSRRLGAGRTGQLLAALAAATCAEYLGAMHELTTTTPDLVFWALILLLVMRLLASRDPRWWLAIGGCAGVAAEAKWNIAFLLAGLAAGFLLTDARRLLASRYLLIGGLIAAVLAAPDVVWQAAHGWPGLDVFRVLQTAAGHNRIVYWPAQVLYTGVVLTPVWVGGAVWSLRSAAARPFRPAA